MSIQRDMPKVKAVLNKESYDFLVEAWPDLVDAISDEINNGARPDEIARFISQQTNRERLVMRGKQAAGYLFAQREKQLADSGRVAAQ